VTGIPTLVLLDASTGVVINDDGRSTVTSDQAGADFPWTPKPVSALLGQHFLRAADPSDDAAALDRFRAKQQAFSSSSSSSSTAADTAAAAAAAAAAMTAAVGDEGVKYFDTDGDLIHFFRSRDGLGVCYHVNGCPKVTNLTRLEVGMVRTDGKHAGCRRVHLDGYAAGDWLSRRATSIPAGEVAAKGPALEALWALRPNRLEEATGISLGDRVLCLYFGAPRWCSPCRKFSQPGLPRPPPRGSPPNTPCAPPGPSQLQTLYKAIRSNQYGIAAPFEFIYVCLDEDVANDKFEHHASQFPGLVMPFRSPGAQALATRFKVHGIPSLVVLDKDGSAINLNALYAAQADPDKFPWHPRSLGISAPAGGGGGDSGGGGGGGGSGGSDGAGAAGAADAAGGGSKGGMGSKKLMVTVLGASRHRLEAYAGAIRFSSPLDGNAVRRRCEALCVLEALCLPAISRKRALARHSNRRMILSRVYALMHAWTKRTCTGNKLMPFSLRVVDVPVSCQGTRGAARWRTSSSEASCPPRTCSSSRRPG